MVRTKKVARTSKKAPNKTNRNTKTKAMAIKTDTTTTNEESSPTNAGTMVVETKMAASRRTSKREGRMKQPVSYREDDDDGEENESCGTSATERCSDSEHEKDNFPKKQKKKLTMTVKRNSATSKKGDLKRKGLSANPNADDSHCDSEKVDESDASDCESKKKRPSSKRPKISVETKNGAMKKNGKGNGRFSSIEEERENERSYSRDKENVSSNEATANNNKEKAQSDAKQAKVSRKKKKGAETAGGENENKHTRDSAAEDGEPGAPTNSPSRLRSRRYDWETEIDCGSDWRIFGAVDY